VGDPVVAREYGVVLTLGERHRHGVADGSAQASPMRRKIQVLLKRDLLVACR